ncbi:MAG: hypothetical protein JW854_15985 [Actinobacteria bacterium]|nr:hypothetical protein [Actinomycetota bacterium]
MIIISGLWKRYTTLDNQTISRKIATPASTVFGLFRDHANLFALFEELGLKVSSNWPQLERGNLYDFSPGRGVHTKVYAQEVVEDRGADLLFLTGPVKGSWYISIDPLESDTCCLNIRFAMKTFNPLFRLIWWLYLYKRHEDSGYRILQWAEERAQKKVSMPDAPPGNV